MTIARAVSAAAGTLAAAGAPPDDARHDAALLARWVLRWSQTDWLTRQGDAPPADFAERLGAAIDRRARHEPVAYIVGRQEFWGLSFDVTPAVLIPRPETELIVEAASAVLHDVASPRVADVGTGSGCLAITIALESPTAQVLAIEVSEAALAVARDNARALGASRVDFWRGAFLPGLIPPLDLVVANPPYVAERDRAALPAEVRDFEPPQALFGGPDGLLVIRALVPAAAAALAPGGWLVMEIGAGQSDDVARLVEETGALRLHHIRPDLQGIPRVVVARRK